MQVIVIGAGIGGLAAAAALHRAGIGTTVYEAVSEIRPLGVGINVQSQAVRVLDGLGLMDALAAAAVPTAALAFYSRHGQLIWRDPRGLAAGYSHPQFSIHRGALQMALFDAVRERLGESAVRTGHRLASFEQRGGRVVARFVDREGRACAEAEGDALIAADGIHSAVRAHWYPGEGPPRWNGVMMWRGVTEGEAFLDGRTMVQAGHERQKFVCYPISKRHLDDGRALINWIADLKLDDREMPRREDWNRPGRLEDFLPRFESWHFGWLDVPAVIRAASAVYEFPMVDRDPLPRWSFGRVTLLGDAAHPMYPIGSNGATQAVLDAECIAALLGQGLAVEEAFARYEAERLPRAAAIVHMNRQRGIDQILEIVEQRAPDGFERLDDVLPRAELDAIVDRYRQATSMQRPG
jgi:2-polyprenyl-6-methoxyphenol hydroxylase-like FAD-dependent oxidoreductase